jgi:FtsP/CotA-like multicopper oxidase with cupredoxin domain
MADPILRDVSNTFVVNDDNLAEFEGFGTDVPNTDTYLQAAKNDPATPRSARVRLPRLLSSSFAAKLVNVPTDAAFPTPDAVPATAFFAREGIHDVTLQVPNGPSLTMWSFSDGNGVGGWPGPAIRVREGQVVHTSMNNHQGPHTIHHHGIEPTAWNDGVGHLTFEVGSAYTYQWLAGEAGTFFYHCHRNTVLHFERGMYGPLIIDPNLPDAPYPTGGPGKTLVYDPVADDAVPVDYDSEAIWVADDIDTRWATIIPKSAGIGTPDEDARSGFMAWNDPQNPRLNDFNPSVFVVTGVPCNQTAANPAPIEIPVVAQPGHLITPAVRRGGKILVRTLNASYAQTRWTFPSGIAGKVIAADGRTLGRKPFGAYSRPRDLAEMNHRFDLSVARRWDVLLDTANAELGDHHAVIGFYHWITGALLREVRMTIKVLP